MNFLATIASFCRCQTGRTFENNKWERLPYLFVCYMGRNNPGFHFVCWKRNAFQHKRLLRWKPESYFGRRTGGFFRLGTGPVLVSKDHFPWRGWHRHQRVFSWSLRCAIKNRTGSIFSCLPRSTVNVAWSLMNRGMNCRSTDACCGNVLFAVYYSPVVVSRPRKSAGSGGNKLPYVTVRIETVNEGVR